MLLSNRYKFLFVHIAKTGGTSIRSALNRLCWRDPLHLPIYVCNRLSHLCGHRIGAKFPRHAPAIAAKEMMQPSFFDSLFKFAFVRNPWDRLVSSYHHCLHEQPALMQANRIGDFHDFARWIIEDTQDYRGPKQVLIAAVRRPQIEHLIDFEGTQIVDFVGRYEKLDTDFNAICRRLGTKPRKLPHKRKASDRRDFRTYYADTTAELVARFYHGDVKVFGMQFDPLPLPDEVLAADEAMPADDFADIMPLPDEPHSHRLKAR